MIEESFISDMQEVCDKFSTETSNFFRDRGSKNQHAMVYSYRILFWKEG